MRIIVGIVLALLLRAGDACAQAAAGYPDARASDPVLLGFMVGAPPPPDKLVRFEDASFFKFPQLRWAYSHWNELFPTALVSRGSGPVSPLPRALRGDLDQVSFTPLGSDRTMTWLESLGANYTDGIVVLHRGRIVYERYFGALQPDGMHIAHSVTKSFTGTLAAMLVAEGALDPSAKVTRYIPELEHSAFADATVGQVLDMTTSLQYDEVYADPKSNAWDFARAAGLLPRPAGYAGPATSYAFLQQMMKDPARNHGEAFAYRSPNAELAGWLIRRVTGKRYEQVLSERLWVPLGMEHDGLITVDPSGAPLAAGGLMLRLRDLARFCEMMRQGGRFNGRQVVPAAVVADIARGADRQRFAAAGYKTLPGWSYHDQWWVSHNDHGAYSARGVNGQLCYVDSKAQMAIARFASFPIAANTAIDPTSLPAYAALADYLMAHPR